MGELSISEIVIGDRYRTGLGDIDRLRRSIQEIGLLHPIVVDGENRLVAGRRRLEACKGLEWSSIPIHKVELENIRIGEIEENICREDFSMSDRVAVYTDVLEREQVAAKERQREAGKGFGKGKDGIASGKLPEAIGEASEQAAKTVGASRSSMERAKKIVEEARAHPDDESRQKILEDMDRTGRVNGSWKRLQILQQSEEIEQGDVTIPKGTFRVIIADPPWQYSNRAHDPSHRGANPYPTMTIEEIQQMDIGSRSHDDCVLWLWTTNSHLSEAFSIVEAWGFTYKTMLTWVKNKMGVGDWLRGKTEHCLLGIRGKPVWRLSNQTTVLKADTREHSRKPEEFYEMMKELSPYKPGEALELFSREERDGITSHGSDKEKF